MAWARNIRPTYPGMSGRAYVRLAWQRWGRCWTLAGSARAGEPTGHAQKNRLGRVL